MLEYMGAVCCHPVVSIDRLMHLAMMMSGHLQWPVSSSMDRLSTEAVLLNLAHLAMVTLPAK